MSLQYRIRNYLARQLLRAWEWVQPLAEEDEPASGPTAEETNWLNHKPCDGLVSFERRPTTAGGNLNPNYTPTTVIHPEREEGE